MPLNFIFFRKQRASYYQNSYPSAARKCEKISSITSNNENHSEQQQETNRVICEQPLAPPSPRWIRIRGLGTKIMRFMNGPMYTTKGLYYMNSYNNENSYATLLRSLQRKSTISPCDNCRIRRYDLSLTYTLMQDIFKKSETNPAIFQWYFTI